MTLVELLTGANVALKLIQARIIVILCLLLTAGLFAWAMYLQTQLGAIIAAAWAVLVFLPVLLAGSGGRHGVETQREHSTEADVVPTRSTARAA